MLLTKKKKGYFLYVPVECLRDEKPITFKIRTLTNIELAEFEDMEEVVDMDSGEVINKVAEVEIKIAKACISGWKNIKSGSKGIPYKGDVEALEPYDSYFLLREVGQYIKAISKDPNMESELMRIREELK